MNTRPQLNTNAFNTSMNTRATKSTNADVNELETSIQRYTRALMEMQNRLIGSRFTAVLQFRFGDIQTYYVDLLPYASNTNTMSIVAMKGDADDVVVQTTARNLRSELLKLLGTQNSSDLVVDLTLNASAPNMKDFFYNMHYYSSSFTRVTIDGFTPSTRTNMDSKWMSTLYEPFDNVDMLARVLMVNVCNTFGMAKRMDIGVNGSNAMNISGGAMVRKTDRKYTLKDGKTRCIYQGRRGAEYIRMNGELVNIKKL